MTERRRAHASQYAQRVNQALALLRRSPVPAVLQTLAQRYRISPRQARRYVDVAQDHPQGLPVPRPAVVFSVKLPVDLVRRLRKRARAAGISLSSLVTRALEDGLERVRPGPPGGR